MWCHEAQDRALAVALAVPAVRGLQQAGRRAPLSAPRPGSPRCRACGRSVRRVPHPGRRRMRHAVCAGRLCPARRRGRPDRDDPLRGHGAKIGSLVINLGSRQQSGVQAAAALVPTLPPNIRERFDLVGFDPRGERRPRRRCVQPMPTTTGYGPTRRWDYSPAGRPHRARPRLRPALRGQDGQRFLATSNGQCGQGSRTPWAALGDEKLTYLGYSYGTRIGASTPKRSRRTARTCSTARSTPMPTRSRPTSARPPRSRRRSTTTPPTVQLIRPPAGHRPGQGRRRLSQHGRPARREAGRDQRSPWSSCTTSPTAAAVFAKPVAHLTSGLTNSRTALATPCWCWPTCTWAATPKATTTTRPTCGWRSTASTSRRHRPPPSKRTAGSERWRRS